jgi:zinc/manganese transport system ATP-binding protein
LNAIEFIDETISFENKKIVGHFNAAIPEGEFVGLFGPNGAGKSTLLKTILGLNKPIYGSALVFGRPPQRGNPEIGYMPQLRREPPSYPLNGRAFMEAALHGTGWGIPHLKKKEHKEIEEAIQLVGLEDYIDRPFTQYSGGERQRLALAQALLGRPKILLLDEPLSNLDPGQQEKIIHLVKEVQEKLQITVLFSGHHLNPLLGVMDHLIYMAHGKAAMGTVDEVVNSKTLSMLYDTPIEVFRKDGNIWVMRKTMGMENHDEHTTLCD